LGRWGTAWCFLVNAAAKDSLLVEDKSRPNFDEESIRNKKQERSHSENYSFRKNTSPAKQENVQTHVAGRRNVRNISHVPKDSNGFELTFSQEETGMERLIKASKPAATSLFQDEAFNTFVTEFDSNKLSSRVSRDKGGKEEALEAEIEKLKEQLKQVNFEKAEITSKFEKLSAICRSRGQEVQELKQTLAARTPSPNKYQASPRIQPSASPPVLFSLMFSPLYLLQRLSVHVFYFIYSHHSKKNLTGVP
jgi:AP2-associated kinase